MQRLALVLLGTTVAMTLSACGGGSSGGDQGSPPITIPTRPPTHTATPSSPTPTPTSTPTSTPTPTPTPTHTVTETAKPGPQACQSGALSLSLGQSQGAAGSTYVPVVLTNTGAKTCTLRGYPGVSFVDASGTLLGKPARQATGSPPKTLKLGSGEAANAVLHMPQPGNYDPSACKPTTADRLRVYPPNETTPLFVKDKIQVCTTATGRTSISPMTFGSGE